MKKENSAFEDFKHFVENDKTASVANNIIQERIDAPWEDDIEIPVVNIDNLEGVLLKNNDGDLCFIKTSQSSKLTSLGNMDEVLKGLSIQELRAIAKLSNKEY